MAALGVLLVRERRYGEVLVVAACLAVGAYLAVDGLVTTNGLLLTAEQPSTGSHPRPGHGPSSHTRRRNFGERGVRGRRTGPFKWASEACPWAESGTRIRADQRVCRGSGRGVVAVLTPRKRAHRALAGVIL